MLVSILFDHYSLQRYGQHDAATSRNCSQLEPEAPGHQDQVGREDPGASGPAGHHPRLVIGHR